MAGKKQSKVAKPSKPAKNTKKPPPPNTDSERSDSEDEQAATSSSAQATTVAVGVAPNPFAMLEEGEEALQEDAWEEVGKKKKKPEKSEPAARPSPPQQPAVARTVLPPSVASVTSALSTARLKAAAATMVPTRTPVAGRPPAASSASPSLSQQDVAPPPRNPRQATHDSQGRPLTNDYYRAFQTMTLDRATGNVTLRFHKTDIVKIRGNGDVSLSCGGYYTRTTMMSMNDTLRYINMRVMAPRMDVTSGEWVVEDAYGKYMYSDNMVIKAQTPADRSRAMTAYRAYHSLDEDGAPGVAPVPKAVVSAPPPEQPAGPPVPPAAPAPGEPPSLAYRLALSNYQTALAAWQHKQQQAARDALKRQDSDVANGGSSSTGHANSGDAYVSTDPSVTMKSANLSAEDYEQWAGDNAPSTAPAAAAAAPAATTASFGDGAGQTDQDGTESGTGDDESLCVICMERERGTVLVPCGHMVLCPRCCENIMQGAKECPLCRQPVSMHVLI